MVFDLLGAPTSCCRKARRAFTRLDLLVALLVVAMLCGGSVVWIRESRAKVRQGECLSNMRQVGLAIQQYEQRSTSSPYSGYRTYLQRHDGSGYVALKAPYPETRLGKPVAISWVIELFPYFDGALAGWFFNSNVEGVFQGPKGIKIDYSRPHPYPSIDALICPSDPPADVKVAPLSYVANTGMRDGPIAAQRDHRANGVFHDHYTDHRNSPTGRLLNDPKQQVIETVLSTYIENGGDGLQYTLMLSENIDAGSFSDTDERFVGFTWAMPTEPVNTNTWTVNPPPNFRRINQDIGKITSEIENATLFQKQHSQGYPDESAPYYYFARPSSYHAGGVNMVFCDGHGQFVSEKIDYYVYCLLMTPRGNEVRDPATGELLVAPGFAGPIGPPKFDEAWLRR